MNWYCRKRQICLECGSYRQLKTAALTSSRGVLMRTGALMKYHHLPSRIRQLALDQPAKIAIRNELNEEITYARLYEMSKSVGEVLKQRNDSGISAMIMAKDPIQMAIGIFGAWFANRAAVPLRKYFDLHKINVHVFYIIL